MRLYCSCGYPIEVHARWDDEDDAIEVHLADGTREGVAPSLVTCPQCGEEVSLGSLRPRSPDTPHWFAWQDMVDKDEDRSADAS